MPNVSLEQSNFSGGEWSPSHQGRSDEPEYKTALALCLNYIPTMEQSLLPRSGFKRLGNTKHNAPAKLIPFRFLPEAPYVAEFTSDNLRLWANGLPIMDPNNCGLTSVSGTPPVFTLFDNTTDANDVPSTWNDGDSVIVVLSEYDNVESAGYLTNREFTITIVSRSAGTIQLTDAVTGTPLSAAVTLPNVGEVTLYRIMDFETNFFHPEGVRHVQYASQTATNVQSTGSTTLSSPDHKVTFFYPLAQPYSLSYEDGVDLGLLAEPFIDGPYLDSYGTTIPLAVSGTTGTITITIYGYDATTIYNVGDVAVSYLADTEDYASFYWLSLTNGNINNALPSSGALINADWFALPSMEFSWSSAISYSTGQVTTSGPYTNEGVSTVYYSLIDSNLNNDPASSPSDWTTTVQAWSGLVSYAGGAVASNGGSIWIAVSPVTGTPPASPAWQTVDIPAAINKLENGVSGFRGGPIFLEQDGNVPSPTSDGHDVNGNPGRLIRFKSAPQPWLNNYSYSNGNTVNYNDVLFSSSANSNLNNEPDTTPTKWTLETQTIIWTWGQILDASSHMFQATVQILGIDLPTATPCWEWRLGVFSNSTGWPTCGCYHEGRLWLSGAIPNRIDGGVTNEGFNFAPTAKDGTVADNNGVSAVLNAAEGETVESLASITEGVVLYTSEAEWLVAASALNDPITPTSIQVHKTTSWSAAPVETARMPAALAAVQRGGRRVFEYRNFIDFTSYQSRLNALDLTRRCQHLTTGGVGALQYQSLEHPILWCCQAATLNVTYSPLGPMLRGVFPGVGDLLFGCPAQLGDVNVRTTNAAGASGAVETGLATTVNLFGIGYMRAPDIQYTAPFSFEHGRTLASGFLQVINSIAVQRGLAQENEYLYCATAGSDGLYYVEMMMPLFDSEPLNSVLDSNGLVVNLQALNAQYGTLASAFYLDSALTPSAGQMASNGLSVTFQGLWGLAGATISFTCMGKYVGDYTIGADGSVTVAFNAAFSPQDWINAGNPVKNDTDLPGFLQEFYYDLNGNTIAGVINPTPFTSGFYGQFGYSFRRRGKLLRPLIGSNDGPLIGKERRVHRAAMSLDAAQEISIGTDFSDLVPLLLSLEPNKNVNTLGPGDFVTGVFRTEIECDYDFNGQVCWEQTNPVPGAILGVGVYYAGQEI